MGPAGALADLSQLPTETTQGACSSLAGTKVFDPGAGFALERAAPHRPLAAAWATAAKSGLTHLLGLTCPQRGLALALLNARAVTSLRLEP